MIRLLAVDMDGTCLNSKNKITPKTLKALQAAAASGIIVVPTTGRALTCLPHQLLAQQGLLYRYVISSNGARVTDCADSTTIYQAEISLADACGLLSALQGQRLGWTAHVNQEYLVQGRLLHRVGRFIYGKDAQTSRRVSQLSETLQQMGQDVEELQLFFLSSSARPAVEATLSRYPQLAAAYGSRYVEIYSQNASKGTALKALAAHLNIAQAEIACIGDGENDLSMFSVSGARFAMGNGEASLKEMADIVLPTQDQDGVAEAIFRHVL